MSIADLLPAVRSILPLNNVDALNRMCSTLCDVVERTLAVPPAPAPEEAAVPALTPQEFLFSALLDGPRPATAVERMAQEHGWPPRVLFKARQQMRVKAMRCGFGPGGYWTWKLPGYMTDNVTYFDCGEWRNFIAGRRASVHRQTLDASS
jgi:hypothetical protein